MTQFTVNDMMIAYSEDAIELASKMGLKLDYSEESLETVNEILERYHQGIPKGIKKLFSKGPSEEQILQMSKVWGGYLGEVIRRNLGGDWEMSKNFNNAISLVVSSTEVYPPAKVNKRILNGKEDDISFYYKVLKQQYSG
ncbi:hypothetical protein GC097_14330 [Paenibacillus sp. LMG 31457]|uniref:Uncharacterized protein n=2 Tax=Paenibacillus planticolens TaxID=2654976 RepID=A0ABX1ZML5_9BACL|nr:hypothetical protein [Paenibacillus planticolens]